MTRARASLWDRLSNNVLSKNETVLFGVVLLGLGFWLGFAAGVMLF